MRIGIARMGPWVLSGDFNELVDPQKKIGGTQRRPDESTDFIQMLKACGLWEIHHFGYQFSWYGQKNNELVQCRLDRTVAYQEWTEKFGHAAATYLHKVSSDHSPLITCLSEENIQKWSTFKYDQRLFFSEGFKEDIAEHWRENGGEHMPVVMELIKECRKAISR